MRIVYGGLLLAGLMAWAPAGQACSLPASAFSIGESTPADQATAELNTPLLVALKNEGFYAGEGPSRFIQPMLTLKAVDSGTEVAMDEPRMVAGFLGSDTTYSFVPSTSLLPNTTYEASMTTGQSPQPGLAGPQQQVWRFTTSDEGRPALSVAGALSVTFERGMVPHMDCVEATSCGPTCTERGTDAVTMARIQLPAVRGGFTEKVANVGVMVTEDEAYESTHIPQDGEAIQFFRFADFQPDQPGELLLRMPARVDRHSYAPCFTLLVSDARGDSAPAQPLCLGERYPQLGDSATEADAANGEAGCSLGGAPAPHGGLALALLALAAALGRRRQ